MKKITTILLLFTSFLLLCQAEETSTMPQIIKAEKNVSDRLAFLEDYLHITRVDWICSIPKGYKVTFKFMQNSDKLIQEVVLTDSSTPLFMVQAPDPSDPKKTAITFGTPKGNSTVYLIKSDSNKIQLPEGKGKSKYHLFDFYTPASASSPTAWCEVLIEKR